MKTIIAPVDFSPSSEKAAFFACNLAAFYGAELKLFHTYEMPVAVGEFAVPLFDIAEMQKAADHELELMKERILSKLGYKVAISCKAELIEFQTGLAELCDAVKPDLVVMGLSGNSPLTSLIVGSNTINTIQHLTYPVLVIPPQADFIPVRKIGFACNYENLVETTPVSLLKKIVLDFKADLFVLNVAYHNEDLTEVAIEERNLINQLLGEVNAEFHNIQSADVTEGINWFAEKCNLDMIVAIPKKHTLFEKMFGRSQTKDLLYHTRIPILCIHQ
jgi:nucleotide-binding universal stress UspA family protein